MRFLRFWAWILRAYYTADMWGTSPAPTLPSSLNFGLLATVMEAVTQVRFDVWMRNEVFAPLNMNASFAIQDLESIENLAVLYRTWAIGFPKWITSVESCPQPRTSQLTLLAQMRAFSPRGTALQRP